MLRKLKKLAFDSRSKKCILLISFLLLLAYISMKTLLSVPAIHVLKANRSDAAGNWLDTADLSLKSDNVESRTHDHTGILAAGTPVLNANLSDAAVSQSEKTDQNHKSNIVGNKKQNRIIEINVSKETLSSAPDAPVVNANWSFEANNRPDREDLNHQSDNVGNRKQDRIFKTNGAEEDPALIAKNQETGDCINTPFTIKHTAISEDLPCEAKFCSTVDGNKRKIDSYNFSNAEPYWIQLLPSKKPQAIWKEHRTANIEIPVLVGGASSNHFQLALLMIENVNKVLRPAYPNTKLFFYDLGLTTNETIQLKKVCNCTIRSFPFDKFPPHTRELFSYTWKPLIIQMMLQTYRFVMWMDASVRFQTADLDPLFNHAKQQGIIARKMKGSLPAFVLEDTFLFLQEPPCLYRSFGLFGGGFILIHSGNSLVNEYIVQPWVKCALIEECMKTKQKPNKNCPLAINYHSCHRYDQAILSILMFRMFHDTFMDYYIVGTYVQIKRGIN